MVTEIENTKLFNELSVLEPEWYYRKCSIEFAKGVKAKWKSLLAEYSISFTPIIFHHYKKAGKKQDRIDLEDSNKNQLRISKSIEVFNLLGK